MFLGASVFLAVGGCKTSCECYPFFLDAEVADSILEYDDIWGKGF